MDFMTKEHRSWNMSRIRSTNTKPEMLVRSFLHKNGFRFRLHVKNLPGHPDIVLPRYKTVIEVRGCFWHRHPGCKVASTPSSNVDFWQEKFKRNVERDKKHAEELKSLGWHLIVVWGCETTKKCFPPKELVDFVAARNRNVFCGKIFSKLPKWQQEALEKHNLTQRQEVAKRNTLNMPKKTTQNETSSAYKRFRKICPIPTPEFIDEQLALYKKTDVYDEEERLIHYFRENRLNKSPFSVRNKVRAVKGFLRSRLSERDLSSRILALAAFDSKLEHGYSTAVDYLTATGLPRWKYSTFAQFYCYFHRPDQYLPGYSVITTLRTYAQLDGFVKEDKTDLILCYSDYRKIVKAFQKYYGLQQYTETELIHFLFMVEQYLQIELDRPAMERRKAKLELEKLKEKIRIRNSMRSSKNDAILQILQSLSGDTRKRLSGNNDEKL